MLGDKLIEIEIKGFNITHYDEYEEGQPLNETFVPIDSYRLTNKQAYMFVPESHQILDIKRTRLKRFGTYDDLMQATTN